MSQEISMNRTPISHEFLLYSGQAFESSDSMGKKYLPTEGLKSSTVNMYVNVRPNAVPGKMYDLGDNRLKLKEPLDIIFKIYPGEVLAVLPELELVGEGVNEMEALEDLKCELLDLHEYLSGLEENDLGKGPRSWKNILQRIVLS